MDFSLMRARTACLLLGMPLAASAGLSFDEATRLAHEQAPALQAQRSTLDGAQALLPAAATLPDPRLIVGLDNLPVTGTDRFSTTADFMTMQRIGLMQEVPNTAKREARTAGAQARIERERALLAVTELAVRRDAALAWLAVYFAESRAARLADLERENQLLQDTLDARIASGQALPAELTMARIDARSTAEYGIPSATLMERQDLSKGWISRIMESLHRKGYLVKSEHHDDRRHNIIELTERGQEIRQAIIEEQAGLCQQVLERIPEDKRPMILPALEQLVAALEQYKRGTETLETE